MMRPNDRMQATPIMAPAAMRAMCWKVKFETRGTIAWGLSARSHHEHVVAAAHTRAGLIGNGARVVPSAMVVIVIAVEETSRSKHGLADVEFMHCENLERNESLH